MTISINKTSKGRATVIVDGVSYTATFDTTSRRWVVQTPTGPRTSTSPKLKSVAALFTTVNVNGSSARRPNYSTRPRTARPRAARPAAYTPKKGGPAFQAPKPTLAGVKLIALAALEDVFVMKLRDGGITQDDRDAFAKYEKLKALALGPVSSPTMATEANSALRMATVNLVKLAF